MLRPKRLIALSTAILGATYGYYLLSPPAHPSKVSREEMERQKKICEKIPSRIEQLKKLKSVKLSFIFALPVNLFLVFDYPS